jgi:hypothetical protein
MRVVGAVRELDAGVPLRAVPCAPAVELPSARIRLSAPAGVFRVDWLRLRSPAPAPIGGTASALPGAVTELGTAGHGRHDGVRVALREPALLVLGESFNRGWRAWCDGRSLGDPRVVDGYANGWRAPASCRKVHFAFAPQRFVNWGYVLSALACALLLALLALRRPGPAAVPAAAVPVRGDGRVQPLPLRRAAAIGFAAALGLGFVFALRAGVFLGPLVAFVLWRGIGARALALAAGALLLLEPAIYLVFLPESKGGGFNFSYPVDLIGAHWAAVAAVVLLGLSLWRTFTPRARRADAPSEPAEAPEPSRVA